VSAVIGLGAAVIDYPITESSACSIFAAIIGQSAIVVADLKVFPPKAKMAR
jgi:hypothetical protein